MKKGNLCSSITWFLETICRKIGVKSWSFNRSIQKWSIFNRNYNHISLFAFGGIREVNTSQPRKFNHLCLDLFNFGNCQFATLVEKVL
ncbi:MAG: hypothetical protein P8048_01040 [Calditrichia bacterium]